MYPFTRRIKRGSHQKGKYQLTAMPGQPYGCQSNVI